MNTYVLLGDKDDKYASCLTTKARLPYQLAIDPNYEVKKEFEASSWNVARIVYEHFNGEMGHFCDQTVEEFIREVGAQFGYEVTLSKKEGPCGDKQ